MAITGGRVKAYIPQVFGDTEVTITAYLGGAPTEPGMGWVFFQAGNPEFPVWADVGVITPEPDGDGETPPPAPEIDEVWIGAGPPTDPNIELWYDAAATTTAPTAGTTILDGNGPPASSLGVVGNYYEDKLNGVFYGPKSVISGVTGAVLSEPFDNFTAAPWTTSANWVIGAGRHGTAARGTGASAGVQCRYSIPVGSQFADLIIGFAHQISALPAGALRILQLESDAGVTNHVYLLVLSNGTLELRRGDTVLLAASAAGVIAANTWAYIEVQCRLGDSPNGLVTLRVNGTTLASPTSIDTKNVGTKTVFDSVCLTGPSSGVTNSFDDLYLKTGSGASFAGDTTVGDPWPVAVRQIPASAQSLTFTQSSAASVWTIDHTLPFQPNVTVVDSAKDQVEGEVIYTSPTRITITFSAAFAGTAYLS